MTMSHNWPLHAFISFRTKNTLYSYKCALVCWCIFFRISFSSSCWQTAAGQGLPRSYCLRHCLYAFEWFATWCRHSRDRMAEDSRGGRKRYSLVPTHNLQPNTAAFLAAEFPFVSFGAAALPLTLGVELVRLRSIVIVKCSAWKKNEDLLSSVVMHDAHCSLHCREFVCSVRNTAACALWCARKLQSNVRALASPVTAPV